MEGKRKIPHTFVIIFGLIVIASMSTWFIGGGEYVRTQKEMPGGGTRTVIMPDSFREVPNQPQTWQIFSALFDGFVDKADIIIFILLIGGAFWILNESKAIDVSILTFLKLLGKLESNILIRYLGINNIVITLIMLMFSVFGSVFGMRHRHRRNHPGW